MKITYTLISSSNDKYGFNMQYQFDGFANNRDFMIDSKIETQNPNGNQGMKIDQQTTFNVSYQELKIKNKPVLTLLDNKSAVLAEWADLYQNPGTLTGDFNYTSNFIMFGNTALTLGSDGVLTYNTTVIPENFEFPFMIKIPKTYNGIIFATLNNNYQLGYNNAQQKFYTIIQGVTTYGELIKITENPFYFTMLNDHVIVRQYNVYKKLSTMRGLKLSDLSGMPLAFMGQENN